MYIEALNKLFIYNLVKAKSILSKKYLFIFAIVFFSTIQFGFTQTSVQFDFTGNFQTYTVSPCQTTLDVIVAGAKGGGNNGGPGAGVSASLPVVPGQILRIYVGGEGACPSGGWNGGNSGRSADNAGNNSCGGGGASDIRVAPYGLANRLIVAGGGGGMGGGTSNAIGGDGGCASGMIGGSPNGIGGQGGTQTIGGIGGAPYQISGMAGTSGALGIGGVGGKDLCYNFAPGGGGGGGYYGGGGGGSDCFATLPNGGGGGGGGSSLIPLGGVCFAASNSGNGYVQIINPEITGNNTGPYCTGGTIQLLATTGATTYSWTGPNFFTSNLQNPVIPGCTVANNGIYTLLTTGTSCNLPMVTSVVVSSTPTTYAGFDDTLCFGFPIQLTPTQYQASNLRTWSNATTGIVPVPTVTFSPSPNVPNPTVTVSAPGMYTFALAETTATCGILYDTIRIVVTEITASAITTSPTCAGVPDGVIQISAPGATQFSFDSGISWSAINTQNTFLAGNYNVCARDANLCSDCVAAVVVNPSPILMVTSNDTVICQNGTASISASSVGGVLLDFEWIQIPTGISYQTMNTQLVSPVVNTWYTVIGENNTGCQTAPDSIFVSYFSSLSGTISSDTLICPGVQVNLIGTASGGDGGPYNFAWSTGETGNGLSMVIDVNPISSTNYSVTLTDNCESSPLVFNSLVTTSIAPVASFASPIREKCERAVFDLAILTDPTTYISSQWSISDGQQYQNSNSFTTTSMTNGIYDVKLVLANATGCTDTSELVGYLVAHQNPTASFLCSPENPTIFNPEVAFIDFSTGNISADWFFEDGNPLQYSGDNTKVLFNNGQIGNYLVTMIATSAFGCTDTIRKFVEVKNDILIYAPNAFTPDGNKFNNTWKVILEGIDPQFFTLTIFDRYGAIIFTSHDPYAEWDGTLNNRILPTGSYNWVIEAVDGVSDQPYFFKGNVLLIK